MQKRGSFFSYFFVFLLLSLAVFGLSKTGFLKLPESLFQKIFSPIESITYSAVSGFSGFFQNSQVKALKEQNAAITKKLIDQKKLIEDNKALRDQFETQSIRSTNLLPANVVGAPSFVPGITAPETLVLDKGEGDGVRVGQAVVFKDNLIGKVAKISQDSSSVILVTNSASSFTAKTLNFQSVGVLKGQGGGEMILDNVLLSETLAKDDTVITGANLNEAGQGFPPGLIIGDIVSVNKNPSSLFQKAEIKSLIDFTKLSTVFIVIKF